MTEPNQATIEAYDEEASTYIQKTPHEYKTYHQPMINWIDAAISGLQNKTVLEIGSATLRDATYIRSRGLKVQTSDASRGFVASLRAQGEDALQLNVLEDTIPAGYGLLFANAVAPHFTEADMVRFLDKIDKYLSTPGQRLAFNVKIGMGESWINEKLDHKRYTLYWQPEDIQRLLSQYDFKIIFFDTHALGDLPNHHWTNIVIER